MSIGTAGLLGIHLKENFNAPLTARNLQDYWNRWHISLSEYMRDMVFTPLSKTLVRYLGASWLKWITVFTITLTFLLTGVWHGFEWNYLFYGVYHGIGLSLLFLYSQFLKKRLGNRMKSYLASPVIRSLSWATTQAYVSFSFFFFENNLSQMRDYTRMLYASFSNA